jgi:ABC-type multidrug transport system fused ATPase/permease subunit
MTVLIIIHRLSTIKNSDYISVPVQGKMIEYGSFKELTLVTNGRF